MSSLLLSVALVAASATAAVDVVATTQAFHAERLANLKKPEGWLSLVGLLWLKAGENKVGSAPDNDLVCPAGWPAHFGRFTVLSDGIRFEPGEPGIRKPFQGEVLKVEPDGESKKFEFGELRVSVIRRGEKTGLRLRDRLAVAKSGLSDIPLYPAAARWRFEAKFEPAPAGATLAITNVLGITTAEPTPGSAVFDLDGKTYRLAATAEDDGTLFFVFGDATNGDTTYGAGRFLEAEAPKNGKVTLDFNRATNPPCAFSPFATCPVPPKGNRLPLQVEAGEQKVAGH